MENLNGRGDKIRNSKEAWESFSAISRVSDPNERERMADELLVRLNLPLVIGILREVFGSHKEMGIIADVVPRTVREWSRGVLRPHTTSAEEQLRLTLRISAIVNDPKNPRAVGAWFKESNPSLGNKAPLKLFTECNPRGVTRFSGELLSVAKDFRRTSIVS